MFRTYKYKGFSFRATDTYTDGNRKIFGKSYLFTLPLYEIDGLKECDKNPLLTCIREVKEYIDNQMP